MSATQPAQALFDISSTIGFKRQAQDTNSIKNNRVEKKLKPTTMTASAEERLAAATAFVEKDVSEHKARIVGF